MDTPYLLTNGTVVSSTGRKQADILVADGKISAVGKLSSYLPTDLQRIDCSNTYVIPGGIDVHTHLDSPMMRSLTADNFRTGTVAAATGGTTTVIDFAQQLPNTDLNKSADAHHNNARNESVIDYGFHMIVSRLYDGFDKHMIELTQDGVSSFKVFMAYRGQLMIDDGQLYDILKTTGSAGATLCVHAENGDVIDRMAQGLVEQGKTGPGTHEIARPPETEVEAVSRAIKISRMAEVPLYFVHLSTMGAVGEVADAQTSGWPIAAETCTHYLSLDRGIYDTAGIEPAKAVLTPPLRTAQHRTALWQGINSGSLSVVSSDHCPFCLSEKQQRLDAADFRDIPNGGPGVEDRMRVLYETGVRQGRISLERFVEITAERPAKQFGLYPKKGFLESGSDADIVVLNPDQTTTISQATQNQAVDYSLYEGFTAHCSLDQVYSRGDLICQNGRYIGAPGRGQFISRETNAT